MVGRPNEILMTAGMTVRRRWPKSIAATSGGGEEGDAERPVLYSGIYTSVPFTDLHDAPVRSLVGIILHTTGFVIIRRTERNECVIVV